MVDFNIVEVDMDSDTLANLTNIVRNKLCNVCDEASMSLFNGDTPENMEELRGLAGETFVNSVIVDALQAMINEDKD